MNKIEIHVRKLKRPDNI